MTVDLRSEHLSVATAGITGNSRIQWDIIEEEEFPAGHCLTPKAVGTPTVPDIPARRSRTVLGPNYLQGVDVEPDHGSGNFSLLCTDTSSQEGNSQSALPLWRTAPTCPPGWAFTLQGVGQG